MLLPVKKAFIKHLPAQSATFTNLCVHSRLSNSSFPSAVETFRVSAPGPHILPPHRGKQYHAINLLTSTSYFQSSQSSQCQSVFHYLCFSVCSSPREDTDLYFISKISSFPCLCLSPPWYVKQSSSK